MKVAINGFGRIGRLVLRAILEQGRSDIEVVAINDLADTKSNAMLFKRDSVHGRYPGTVEADGQDMIVDGKRIRVTAERDPSKLPHKELGVDIALECTGFFTDADKARAHLDAGAKRVLISAPGKGVDLTVVYGVNHQKLTADHRIVSNASCTTNCLAPVAMVMNQLVGIERGLMTTLHRNQHRTHRDHGLSRTHIALQQPMHGMAFSEVFVDLNDCPSLSASEVIGKHLMKALHQRPTTITNNMSDSNSGSFEFSFAPNQFHLHA